LTNVDENFAQKPKILVNWLVQFILIGKFLALWGKHSRHRKN